MVAPVQQPLQVEAAAQAKQAALHPVVTEASAVTAFPRRLLDQQLLEPVAVVEQAATTPVDNLAAQAVAAAARWRHFTVAARVQQQARRILVVVVEALGLGARAGAIMEGQAS